MVGNLGTGQMPPVIDDGDDQRLVFWTADHLCATCRSLFHVSGPFLLVQDAISRIDTKRECDGNGKFIPRRDASYIYEEIEYPEVIGTSNVVETNPSDTILYAQRPRQKRLSRLVRGREPEPTRYFTVILMEQETAPGTYRLLAGWIGRKTEPEPCDYYKLYSRGFSKSKRVALRRRSKLYWETHAYVESQTLFLPATLTDKQPKDWYDVPTLPKWRRFPSGLQQGGLHGSSNDVGHAAVPLV